ncbi:MAG: hypothetical protein K2F57_06635, partial [Candidatus Gastranaerophilales bacterium]|nr:hypothetical protein [Candidatus Gastranaerophilales bacterium]
MNKRLIALLVLLCILSTAAIYRNSNMDKILAAKAEKAYKKNNIAAAQEYLEQSFALGTKDYKLRELYVNSIITSPFDEKAQEKLINFLEYPVDDAAKIKAEYFLQDYRSKINQKYPHNYIKQTAYNHLVMRWNKTPI